MTIPYATFAELQERFGASALQEAWPKPLGYDASDPDYDAVETWAENLLLEASAEIDGYLRRAGYAAPLVEADNTTVLAEEADRLRGLCLSLTLGDSESAHIGEGESVQNAATRARAVLAQIVKGSIRLDAPLAPAIVGKAVYPRTAPTTANPYAELGRAVAASRGAPE